METNTATGEFPHSAVHASVGLAALYEAMPAGLCQFDRDFRIVRINPALARMNGLPVADHIGKTPKEVVPNLAAEVEKVFHRVLASGLPARFELRGTTAAHPGEERVWDEHWYPVHDDNGSIAGVGAIIYDITDQVRIREALAETTRTAERANAAKDKFLAALSHELRTPLTPALVAIDSMLESHPADELRAGLELVQRNVALEIKLIDDLLDLSRVVSGKLFLDLRPVDINSAVREACHTCEQAAQEKKVSIETQLDPNSGRVNADPARLQQMLWNLLRNAVKFSPDGGRIQILTKRTSADILVQVRDEGIGISPEALRSIFNAFEQAGEQIGKQFGGLGLGLAITRSLAEQHGGEVSAESGGLGKGATFTLTLPAITMDPSTIHSPVGDGTSGDCGSLRVLLVEDHRDTAAVLTRGLSKRVARIRSAHTIGEALRLCAEESFDVVISDIGLPDGTGYTLMQEIGSRFNIPGIAMSGYGMADDLKRSRDAGFVEHLTKPVRIHELTAALNRRFSKRSDSTQTPVLAQ